MHLDRIVLCLLRSEVSLSPVSLRSFRHNMLCFFQGSSARLVLPVILGKRRVWREIQNLYTYEVCASESEKSAPLYCFEGTPLRYSAWFVGLDKLAQ